MLPFIFITSNLKIFNKILCPKFSGCVNEYLDNFK